MKKLFIDKTFLILVLSLAAIGFLLFFSVSLGTLDSTSLFFKTVVKQFIALIFGLSIMFALAYSKKFDYKQLKFLSLWLFLAAVLFQIMVFIPGIGIEVNGAQRWVDIGFTTLQPSEFLKIATVLFLSALAAQYGKKLKEFVPLMSVMILSSGLTFLLLFVARDIGTILVVSIAIFAVLFISHARNIHLIALGALGGGSLLLLVFFFRRYAWERLISFAGTATDTLGSDFQINQSLYTIGSGEIFGRGFGQSLQKFAYLPEPLSDSIFAVTAEEWGFVGSVVIVGLLLALILRGIHIAKKSKDRFGMYVATGLVMLIGAQCFINIAAMLKLFPLSGMPLLFISQGGSALLGVFISCGIILNISRSGKKK